MQYTFSFGSLTNNFSLFSPHTYNTKAQSIRPGEGKIK